MSRGLAAMIVGPLLAAAAGPAAGQPTAAAPLDSPAQAKVAAPAAAPSVKAGDGKGPAQPAVTEAAAAMVARNQAFGQHVRELNWPGGPVVIVPTGLNHFRMELKMPDGRTLVNEQQGPLLVTSAGSVTAAQLAGPSPYTVAYGLRMDGATLTGYSSYILASGEIIDPPPIAIPLEGGSKTVSLPGGGTFTLTLAGAHPITDAERTRAQTMVNILRSAASAQAAQGAQAKAP